MRAKAKTTFLIIFRRAACLESAKLLGLESLREASLELVLNQRHWTILDLDFYPWGKYHFAFKNIKRRKIVCSRDLFDEVTFRRVRHVVTEIPRYDVSLNVLNPIFTFLFPVFLKPFVLLQCLNICYEVRLNSLASRRYLTFKGTNYIYAKSSVCKQSSHK
jgi:hypothetical protein